MSAVEARRQQALLAALHPPGGAVAERDRRAFGDAGGSNRAGLAAYRGNAAETAERALAASFGTVQALLGADAFAQLARAFWRAEPPTRGDLAEWGDTLPDWLRRQAGLAEWPYLGDCAALDRALFRNERAADADVDAASLLLLDGADPQALWLQLMPGSALLRSAWPIARIHAAHQLAAAAPDAADQGFDSVRAQLAAGVGDDVFIVREGWRATALRVDAARARFTEHTLAGAPLGAALAAAGEAFDFSAWLVDAVTRRWLQAVVRRDPGAGVAP